MRFKNLSSRVCASRFKTLLSDGSEEAQGLGVDMFISSNKWLNMMFCLQRTSEFDNGLRAYYYSAFLASELKGSGKITRTIQIVHIVPPLS